MQNKGFVKFIAICLTLICLFYLSFSFVTRHYEQKAEAMGETAGKAYLDSLRQSDKAVWLGYDYKKCEAMQIGLGLDLKGGVVVREVLNGPAAMIGLRPGDVITHLNNQAIDSTSTFAKVAQELPKNRSVSMRVLRQGRASFITFKLAE